jgi:hypothetical protein
MKKLEYDVKSRSRQHTDWLNNWDAVWLTGVVLGGRCVGVYERLASLQGTAEMSYVSLEALKA